MRDISRTTVALAVGSAISMGAQASIMITEYAEPAGGNNKLIEIGNTGTSAVSLDNYTLKKDSNGNGTFTNVIALDGLTVQPDSVVIVGHSGVDESAPKLDLPSGKLDFNGNDAVGLFNPAGELLDIVGSVDGQNFGKNVVLRRSVLAPATEYDAAQWERIDEGTGKDYSGFGAIGEGVEPPPPEDDLTAIMELQGDSWASPYTDPANGKFISDQSFTVVGIVTAIQSTALGEDLPVGFFIQDEMGDGDPKTSDGIFVLGDVAGLAIGDQVKVAGKVTESYGWTQLIETSIEKTGMGTVNATTILSLDEDEDFDFTLERHEGMLVKFETQSDMRVARTYGFDEGPERNNMVMAHQSVNIHPNQSNLPGSAAAKQHADCNDEKRVVVESFAPAADGVIPWYPNFGKDNGTGATENYIRVGDIVDGLEGVLAYSFSDFRLYVTTDVTKDSFVREGTDRTPAPVLKGADVRVATFNVLNYFNSPFGGDDNPTGQNRGAETAEEFEVQASKIVAAISAMDADILGLMEIENNGYGENSAVADLVSRLNENRDESDQYTVAHQDGMAFVGTGAITNQVIFKAAKVSLEALRVIPMPQQHASAVEYTDLGGELKTESGNNYMRDSVAPTFAIKGSDEKLTVAVNHFKSKDSTCWEDVQTGQQLDDDQQGSCENLRVSGAYHLGQSLASIKGHKLIIGDLNSYANEDPITVLTNRKKLPEGYEIKAARDTYIGGDQTSGTLLHGNNGAVIDTSYGYVNAVRALHPGSYGYAYNDSVGTLDYVLASPSLVAHITDATEWNINAVESTLFEYANKNSGDLTKYNDAYRSSDHDPAIVALTFTTTDPVDPPAGDKTLEKGDNGGSVGFLGLLSLLGFGFFRRKVQQ